MLNSDKTEVILLGPEHLRDQWSGDVDSVDGIALASNTTVKNLCVIFNRDLSCNSHVKQISLYMLMEKSYHLSAHSTGSDLSDAMPVFL